ncbi:Threonine efflux protein [Thalassocella blandensis]|nr:Threonine efflux protein [Thalassocella blandensis]
MDLNTVLAFMVVAALLVISPGPNGLLVAKTVPLSGKSAGLANVLGFVVAFYVHGALSILGVSIVLMQSAQLFFLFKMFGAAYLIWIGLSSLIGAFKRKPLKAKSLMNVAPQKISLRTAFLEGFFTNLLNPKVSLFYLAAFPHFISVDESILNSVVLVSAHSLINFIWFSAMVCLLARFTHLTSGLLFKRCLQYVTGVIFIVFGFQLAMLEKPR